MMHAAGIEVRQLESFDAPAFQDLEDVLISCVDAGASVGFMQPMTQAKAAAFWRHVATGVAQAERLLLAAYGADGHIVGTAQLVLAAPENQPHRADVAKMLVHPRARRQGVGAALLRAAEDAAFAMGRVLLVLDTANDAAVRLYTRGGWKAVGTIPNFALWPQGGYCDTIVFYKQLTSG